MSSYEMGEMVCALLPEPWSERCEWCGSTGLVNGRQCRKCRGMGWIMSQTRLYYKVSECGQVVDEWTDDYGQVYYAIDGVGMSIPAELVRRDHTAALLEAKSLNGGAK